MPSFPSYAQRLADGMAREHGHSTHVESTPPLPEMATVGQELCSVERFKCFDCHSLGENTLSQAVFEAPGPDLRQSAERLRPDFFLRWMLDPMRQDPATRMTQFATDRHRTQMSDVLDGNAEQQFKAIREWLRSR